MTAVRILADDLTGALDAAAPFAAKFWSPPVVWRQDSGTARLRSHAVEELAACLAECRVTAIMSSLR